MKKLFKIAAVCLGLFFAAPSFSQVTVELGHRHYYGRHILYGPERYHVWMNRGVIYRDDNGPAVRIVHSRTFFRDADGRIYHYDNGVRVFE